MLFVAAVFFWLKGNEVRDRRRNAAPGVVTATNKGAKLELLSTSSMPVQITQLSQPGGSSPNQVSSRNSTPPPKPHPYLVRNTLRPVDDLMRDNRAILLVNAFIDTAADEALDLPAHLQAEEPTAFIVQSRGEVNTLFRKALENAGAEVVAYVPNNAYLVKSPVASAQDLRNLPEVSTVIPFEPYFKLDKRLIATAVNEEALPNDAFLRLTLFPGERETAINALQSHITDLVAEEPSPFGPQLIVRPLPDSLAAIARLGSVQAIEPDLPRSPAADITRVSLGISTNSSTTENWLGLRGSNIWVNMNDLTVETNHPALSGRVIAGHPDVSSTDPDGHGTFVAGLIVGDGSSAPSASSVQGSETNANFRGMAPLAKLLALPIDSGPLTQARILDTYLTETAARSNYFTLNRTNALISNNSWNYVGASDYDSAAARYDAATRDSLAGATGEQPVLYVFAAGNGGFGDNNGEGGTSGSIYSPGTAKNVLTVGALEHPRFITNYYTITNEVVEDDGSGVLFTNTIIETNYVFLEMTDSMDQVASFSSRGNVGTGFEGPFGRFKPDVVAPGTMLVSTRSSGWKVEDHFVVTNEPGTTISNLNKNLGQYRYDSGSTYAAATVSGMLALIQEFFETKAPTPLRTKLSPALMKGLVINGSRSLTALYDLNPTALINHQGWGLPGLQRSLPTNLTSTVTNKWPLRFVDQSPTNALATGQSRTWNVTLGTNTAFYPVRFTLVWTDPPGNPVVGVKLVNDLDLVVTNLDTGTIWYGNYITSGSDFNQPIATNDTTTLTTAFDRVNNVENIFIGRPENFGRRFSVTVRARRVNVNSVHNFTQVSPGTQNDIVQDFALVVSSDIGVDDPEETEDIFERFESQAIRSERYNRVLWLTNGLPLLNERVAANSSFSALNGTTNQWNFYVFTNRDIPNSFATTRAGTNVAFVTFNPPNLASPSRNIEADIDLYVSTDSGLTNLTSAALGSALKSLERGGTETVVLSNATIGQVFYIGVKSEDQQAAEFSLMGLSTDLPFEQDINGRKVLNGVPVSGFVPDGSALQPQASTMMAIGLSQNRVLRTVITNVVSHENLGDLVGILRHGPTQVVLNNHTLNSGNFRGTNIVLGYDDSPYFGSTNHTDGPGNLNNFAGSKVSGPWILSMIDNAPGHTGRVERMTIYIDPLQDNLLPGVVISGSVSDNTAVYPIDVPPGAVNLNVRVFDISGSSTRLEAYLNQPDLPTPTNYLAKATNAIGSTGFQLNYASTNQPPLTAGTWFLALRNPVPGATVNFKIIILFEYDFSRNNALEIDLAGPRLLDDATTNQVIQVSDDKVVTSAEVSVHLPHPRISDVALRLVSPQGTRVLLAEQRGRFTTSGFGGTNIYTNQFNQTLTNESFTIFTENTNLAKLPLKFVSPPYFQSSTNLGVVFTNSFEGATNGNYPAGTVVDGWTVGGTPTNIFQYPVQPQVSIWNNPALSHSGSNFVSLGTGTIERDIPTQTGQVYRLTFAYRSALPFPIYNTGLNNDRTVRQQGLEDLHYTMTSTDNRYPGPFSHILSPSFPLTPPGPWLPNTTSSQWIAPYAIYDNAGTIATRFYDYTTYVNMYGYRTNAFFVSLRLAADNNLSSATFNGVPILTAPTPIDSYSFWPPGGNVTLPRPVPGINILTVSTRDTGEPTGFRLETTGERLSLINPSRTNPAPTALFTVGNISTNDIGGADQWRIRTYDFIATGTNTLLKFSSLQGEIWIDSVMLQKTGDLYVLPEEPLELVEGERALGDWALELVDLRTGATNPIPELVRWKLNLTYAEPIGYAEPLAPGNTYPTLVNVLNQPPGRIPGRILTNQIQYFYVDTCPDTTRATINLIGLTNIGGLELFIDRSGLPTGDPETDDFVLLRNFATAPGSSNGTVTVTLTTQSPASAPLQPGKRLYFAIQNRFISQTNHYTLRVDLDRANCIIPQPFQLQSRQSVTSSLSQANTGDTEGELFRHEVSDTQEPFAVEATSTEGDLQILVSKDLPPSRQSFTYSANATATGTERLEISSSAATPLEPGTYYIRVLNNSANPATFSIVAESATVPEIQGDAGFVNGQFTLSFTSSAGVDYEIQSSTDLENWTTEATVTASSDMTVYSAPADQTTAARFYRILRKP